MMSESQRFCVQILSVFLVYLQILSVFLCADSQRFYVCRFSAFFGVQILSVFFVCRFSAFFRAESQRFSVQNLSVFAINDQTLRLCNVDDKTLRICTLIVSQKRAVVGLVRCLAARAFACPLVRTSARPTRVASLAHPCLIPAAASASLLSQAVNANACQCLQRSRVSVALRGRAGCLRADHGSGLHSGEYPNLQA